MNTMDVQQLLQLHSLGSVNVYKVASQQHISMREGPSYIWLLQTVVHTAKMVGERMHHGVQACDCEIMQSHHTKQLDRWMTAVVV